MIKKAALTLVFSMVLLFAFTSVVSAQSRYFTYDSYDVEMDVHSDSTVDVTETLTYRFNGTYSGVIRQLTLDNPRRDAYCQSSGLTCGGFERVALLGVYDEDGSLVPADQYELYVETVEDTGESYFTVKWVVWDGGRTFDGSEAFSWSIKYRLYGSLGWVGASESTAVPYLYWNALPETRGGSADYASVLINLPSGYTVDANSLEVYTSLISDYYYTEQGDSILIEAENLGSVGDFTVAYQLPEAAIQRPAEVSFYSWLPWFGINIELDGVGIGDIRELNNFPAGVHSVKFSFPGYESKTAQLSLSPGERLAVDASLTPTLMMWILIFADALLNVIGILLAPFAAWWMYNRWRNLGRDINMPATIVPTYHPPEGVHPYLLGSIKDEKVDREDITGTIIDLAYRGFIKIKELEEGKNYELQKLDKDISELNGIESQLLDDIFGGKDTRETKDLGKRFASRYQKLQNKIYQEMVELEYFNENPNTVRLKYFGGGALLLTLGGVLAFALGFIGVPIMGVIGPVFLGIGMAAAGLAMLVAANYMPAKTAKGSQALAEILGFRMYLHHAERYRLQNLTPEEFERYLSYAVVFGIEKEWADKFKDIYKGQPDWYEGQSSAVWDAYWLSRMTRSFADSVNSSVYVAPSSGSAGGGGWSGGGGSFGGFSGGGGGGGGSGAF